MKLYYNYKKEGFFQILPLLFIKDRNQLIVLLGFGKKNIAFVFGKNLKEKPILSPLTASESVKNVQSNAIKRWVAKVNKTDNSIRIEAEEEPITNATKVKIDTKMIMTIVSVVAVGAIFYYIIKKRKR